MKIEEFAATWQVGLLLLTRPLHKMFPEDLSIERVCQNVGVSRSAAYEALNLINKRLMAPTPKSETPQKLSNQREHEYQFEIEILHYELKHPGSRIAGERTQFDPFFKDFVEDRRAHYGVTLARAGNILNISIDSLKKFSRSVGEDVLSPPGTESEKLPGSVIELVNAYLRYTGGVKSVKDFCRRNPELLQRLGMTYRQVLRWLRRLGFVSRRGIFIKNKGLDKIIRFKPNQVWGTDGKRIIVTINGETFEWLWQCLVDGKTTVIVGGLINHRETTENLLEAIKESKARTGISPLAIVMDNRLSENMPAIEAYLKDMGIEIIKTFPGNPKGNAIAEGNFNVFDRWVGKIQINGATPEEMSRSIANAFVEVFTQMRNHSPRPALSHKSAKEVADESIPATPEEEAEVRTVLKALADRHNKEQAQPHISEQKRQAILQAAKTTGHPDSEVLEKKLQSSRYTSDLILQSLAIFQRQKELFPEKQFHHSYFGGILRKLVDQKSVEALNIHLGSVYATHWDTMAGLTENDRALSLQSNPLVTCTRLASDFMAMPIPAFSSHLLLDLKEAFLVASKGSVTVASTIRSNITEFVLKSTKALLPRREELLRTLYGWENFVRLCDPTSGPLSVGPCGHA